MRGFFVFLLLLSFGCQEQTKHASLMDQYLQAKAKVNEFSGTVLVAQNDKILYEKAFGLANREWNLANTLHTKFRIGSLTKQFTAAAILQLVEAGKLKLEDKLSKYFPDFPKADSVTLHMLLTHTSGIKSYTDMPKFRAIYTLPYPKDSVVAFFKNEPYEFSPGTQWRYNNSGYFLLGYILEKVSGQAYSDYVENNLVRKAGLTNTSVDRLDSILPNRAAGYVRAPNGWRNAHYISMEFPYSAGAIVSTVEDLYRWNKALYSGKIVSPALLTKMTTAYKNKYGYGLFVDSLYTHKRIHHGGGNPGFASYNVYYPADNLHIIVLSNNDSPAPGIAGALAAILFDKEVELPYKHQAVPVNSKDLEPYVGKYQTPYGPWEIVLKEGKLYVKVETGDELALTPESNHKFFFADEAQLNFELDKDHSIRHAQLITYGFIQSIKKIE